MALNYGSVWHLCHAWWCWCSLERQGGIKAEDMYCSIYMHALEIAIFLQLLDGWTGYSYCWKIDDLQFLYRIYVYHLVDLYYFDLKLSLHCNISICKKIIYSFFCNTHVTKDVLINFLSDETTTQWKQVARIQNGMDTSHIRFLSMRSMIDSSCLRQPMGRKLLQMQNLI